MFKRVLLVIFLVSLLFGGIPVASADESQFEDVVLLEEIMDRLRQFHLEKPDADQLLKGAINGMLDTAGDPYTEYFSPAELEEFANSLDNDLYGIGVELKPGNDYPAVVRVIPSSPAEKVGIQAGDLIVAVDGVDVKGFGLGEVVRIIRGPEGSEVVINVDRQGKGKMEFTVVRGYINIPTVDFSLLDEQTGYIYVSSFGVETATEFSNALENLLEQDIKSIVLDLRNNGGGYLQAAVEMVSEFLPPGSKVVSIVDGDGKEESSVTSGQPAASALNVVIVVNENSASAAEVMAGALRDYNRAVLVGTPTYGKGVMQTVIPLSNGGALKVTTHRYFTPSGTDLNGIGLMPDRQVITPELKITAAAQEVNKEELRLEYVHQENIVRVGDRDIDFSLKPFSQSGSLFVPLLFSLEAVGYEVFLGSDCIRIIGFGDTLEVYPESGKVILNQQEKVFNNPVLMRQGMSYISIDVLEMLKLNMTRNTDSLCIRLMHPLY